MDNETVAFLVTGAAILSFLVSSIFWLWFANWILDNQDSFHSGNRIPESEFRQRPYIQQPDLFTTPHIESPDRQGYKKDCPLIVRFSVVFVCGLCNNSIRQRKVKMFSPKATYPESTNYVCVSCEHEYQFVQFGYCDNYLDCVNAEMYVVATGKFV